MTLTEMRRRLRPPGPVLDVHTHPLRDFGPYRVSGPEEDARGLRSSAERAGVQHLCIFTLGSGPPPEPSPEQFRQANDYSLRLRDLDPDLFLPFCYVSPGFPGPSVAEVERCIRGHRMSGVKVWIARRATDPGLDPILEAARDLGVPVLQHAWRKTVGQLPGESYPADVAHLARRHPTVPIIMAHLNGVNPRGLEDVADCPNVLVDTSGGDPECGMVELAVERLGPKRVVFGSDTPIRHFAVTLSKVLGARLDAATRRAILYDNAAGILPAWAGLARHEG
ncbi:MAG: amidohydrolase family protein [Candidatus Latescibacterota bacterium]